MTGPALPVSVPAFENLSGARYLKEKDSRPTSRLIIQSPYVEEEHLLDLNLLSQESATLAIALGHLRPTRNDYATAPYDESFNWLEVINEVKRLVKASGIAFRETSFYIVAFCSQIKPSTEYGHLGEMDKAAHAEAVASGGFLKYWFGTPNSELRNLATCIWNSRQEALQGGRGPAHRKAASSTRALYASWRIDQYRLTISDGAAHWEIVPWGD